MSYKYDMQVYIEEENGEENLKAYMLKGMQMPNPITRGESVTLPISSNRGFPLGTVRHVEHMHSRYSEPTTLLELVRPGRDSEFEDFLKKEYADKLTVFNPYVSPF